MSDYTTEDAVPPADLTVVEETVVPEEMPLTPPETVEPESA